MWALCSLSFFRKVGSCCCAVTLFLRSSRTQLLSLSPLREGAIEKAHILTRRRQNWRSYAHVFPRLRLLKGMVPNNGQALISYGSCGDISRSFLVSAELLWHNCFSKRGMFVSCNFAGTPSNFHRNRTFSRATRKRLFDLKFFGALVGCKNPDANTTPIWLLVVEIINPTNTEPIPEVRRNSVATLAVSP